MLPRSTVRRRFSRRGVFLAVFGIIYVALGATIAFWPTPRFSTLGPIVGAFLDSPWWGGMWLIGGAAALAVAARTAATGSRDDAMGFVALLVPPAVWTLFYIGTVAVWAATAGAAGEPRSLTAVVVWSLAWSVVLLVSGWPDPDDTSPPGPGRR